MWTKSARRNSGGVNVSRIGLLEAEAARKGYGAVRSVSLQALGFSTAHHYSFLAYRPRTSQAQENARNKTKGTRETIKIVI